MNFFDVKKKVQTKPDSWKPLLRHPEDNLKMQFSVKNRGENKTSRKYQFSKKPHNRVSLEPEWGFLPAEKAETCFLPL